MHWGVAEAKQQLSKVLRAARDEPQVIETRGALVAAVLGPDEAAAYFAWRKRQKRRSLGDHFAEARRIVEEEGVELTLPERADRPNALLAPERARPRRRTPAQR